MYVELHKEDAAEGQGGLLRKPLYGTRDAAQNSMDAYIKAMEDAGFVRGAASPCAFRHTRREIRGLVHGDGSTIWDMPNSSVSSRGRSTGNPNANIGEESDPLITTRR